MRWHRFAETLVLTGILLACKADTSPQSRQATVTDLRDRSLPVVHLLVDGEEREIVPGSSPILRFTATDFLGHTGCTGASGKWSLDGDRLVLSDLGTNMIDCPGQIGEQGNAMYRAFFDAPTIYVEGDKLVIAGHGVKIIASED